MNDVILLSGSRTQNCPAQCALLQPNRRCSACKATSTYVDGYKPVAMAHAKAGDSEQVGSVAEFSDSWRWHVRYVALLGVLE